MPWAENETMDLRACFVAAYLRAEEPMNRLCERSGISRKTGYKWLDRYRAGGALGLEDRSSAPQTLPHRISGWFRTKDGIRCEPLTISDGFSRYLLVCHAVPKLTFDVVRPLFEKAFQDNGMPRAIRTDNGSPFASILGLEGLSRLSVRLLKLGIWPERLAPGRPDQNGRHERFHRTLGEENALPPAATLAEQQARFDAWRQDYNTNRPHQALGQQCPTRFYSPASRPFPEKLTEWDCPPDHHVRRVNADGYLKWRDEKLYLLEALRGEYVGIDRQDDLCWIIRFRDFYLSLLEDASGKIVQSRLGRSR